jgi:putative acetyltransferase
MITLKKTDSEDPDFITLVRLLDTELAIADGEEHLFYSQFNKIDNIKYVLVAYDDGLPVGCGAIKEFGAGVMEVKRMFVLPGKRNIGFASGILSGLESWAAELLCTKCVLETGKRQPDAIALYKKNGYKSIPNYGQYKGVENSVCFAKNL